MPAAPDAVRRLFDELASMAPVERQRRLAAHDDPSVAGEVRQLLEASAEATLLDRAPLAGDPPPARIGPYRIESELGRGGMGVVYRATRDDDAFRKTVAIKLVGGGMPPEVFRRERQIMASLEHPNIARLLDGGATGDGSLYFVMEYVEGQTLLRHAEAAGLSLAGRLALFHQVCGAVEYAHRNLVVHRDLKPSNILVTREGVVKLLDFGIAKVLEPDRADAPTVAAGGLTPRYASPEQILNRPLSTLTDIYSLGVILFELLTGGQHPFALPAEGASFGEYVEAILHGEPRRPSQFARGLDRDLDQIAAKALAREAGHRYESAAALRDDLERYLAGLPVRARGAGWRYRAAKFARRNRGVVVLAAALVAAIAGGFGFSLREYRTAGRERATAVRLAEQREVLRREAEAQASAAVRERGRAEERLAMAQSLASSILFDAYDGLRDLPGPAAAKVKLIERTLGQLENLLRISPGDTRTLGLVANAYERAGDITSGVSGEGTDPAAAIPHYRRCLELRERIVREDPRAFPLLPVTARLRLAAALARVGQVPAAMAELKLSLGAFAAAPAPLQQSTDGRRLRTALYDVACEVAGTHSHQPAETLNYCREASRSAARVTEREDPRVLLVRAANWGKMASLARNQGRMTEALDFLEMARRSYEAFLGLQPGSAEGTRGLSILAGYLAAWQDDLGNLDAAGAYEKALQLLDAAARTSGQPTTTDLYRAWMRMRYARLLAKQGKLGPARERAAESLAIHAQRTKGGTTGAAGELNDYADHLLKCPIPELRDAPLALRLARRAVEQWPGSPILLDTLANAQFANGETAEAIATARRALALLDRNNLPALRTEVESSLARFQAGQHSAVR